MINRLKKKIRNYLNIGNRDYAQDDAKILLAQIRLHQLLNLNSDDINDYEFKVFSQWGDDGIIQFLINRIKPINKTFIEFGVGDYFESNTRFLLMNNNWSGLVIDGSTENINSLKNSEIYWKYDLKAESSFITKKNINALLAKSEFSSVGLLHIDLDGNDYWIFNELDLEKLKPTILVFEYNSVFGSDRAISVPYKEDFVRFQEHHSNLFWGASLPAWYNICRDLGYSFVGCNSSGINAFFVKNEFINGIKVKSISEGYRVSKFADSRDVYGNLTFVRGKHRLPLMEGLGVINVLNGNSEKL